MIDLGNGYSLKFTSWAPDRDLNPQYDHLPDVEKYGAMITCPHSTAHITFDGEVQRELGEEPRWTVESWEPLTINPSVASRSCSCHGFIREGKWQPA